MSLLGSRSCLIPLVLLAAMPGLAGTIFQSSFETSPAPAGFYTCFEPAVAADPDAPCGAGLSPVNPLPPEWELIEGSVDLVGSYWQADTGLMSLDLDGFGARGTVRTSSALPTIAGRTYLVSFALSANPDPVTWPGPGDPNQALTKYVRVYAGDEFADFQVDVAGKTRQDMQWQTFSFTFTGTGSDYLVFQSATPDADDPVAYSWGAALDSVQVDEILDPEPPDPITEVPEPGTMYLVGAAGLALLVRFLRK